MIPKNLQEISAAKHPTYIGGGTDIMPLLKNHVRNDQELVFLNQLPELKGIEETADCVYIGAGETLTTIAESALVNEKIPAVAQAAAVTASPAIRNIGTLGGNIMQDRRCIYFNQTQFWRSGLPLCFKTDGKICHQIPNSPVCRAIYYSDVATALITYDAEAECMENGETSWVAVEDLVRRHTDANGLACGEHLPVLVIRFRIPKAPAGEVSGFHKYCMRATIDFPLINFALRCKGDRPAKLVAGAVAIRPVVLEETAKLLDTDASNDEIVAACEAELKKLAMPIKEACITPAGKRDLYRQIKALLHLRKA